MQHMLGHEVVDAAGEGVEGLPAGRKVQILTEHLHPPLQVVGVLRQAVAADPGPRPEDGAGDPFALQRRHPGPDKRRH